MLSSELFTKGLLEIEFGFQISRGLFCRLLSIRFLAYIRGSIESRKTNGVANGLKIECGLGTSVGFLSGQI